MILVILDNKNTKNEVTKICNEPGKQKSSNIIEEFDRHSSPFLIRKADHQEIHQEFDMNSDRNSS
jgi:hypothetical protein